MSNLGDFGFTKKLITNDSNSKASLTKGSESSVVREYFNQTESEGIVKNACRAEKCSTVIHGKKTFNLYRHLERSHPEWHKEALEKTTALLPPAKRVPVKRNADGDPKFPNAESHKSNTSIEPHLEKPTYKVQCSEQQLVNNCVEIVTKNGRPFEYLNDSGFQKIVQTLTIPMPKTKAITINSRTIPKQITETAQRCIQYLTDKFSKQLINLKIDIGTRLDKSFLGINTQIVENNEVKIYTFGVVVMKEQKTAENIKSAILNELKNFNISEDQIFAITTDNGSNVVKCANSFNSGNSAAKKTAKKQNKAKTKKGTQVRDPCPNINPMPSSSKRSDLQLNNDNIENIIIDDTDDQIFFESETNDEPVVLVNDSDLDDDSSDDSEVAVQPHDPEAQLNELYEEKAQKTRKDVEELMEEDDKNTEQLAELIESGFPNTIHLRCAAHCLQLALHDAFKEFATMKPAAESDSDDDDDNETDQHSFDLIKECRDYAKLLRRPNVLSLLRKKPPLDVKTRWLSSYDMIKGVYDLKDECKDLMRKKDFKFLKKTDLFWDRLKNMMNILSPLKTLTLKLQSQQLMITDAYFHWMVCEKELEANKDQLASILLRCMQVRSRDIFATELFDVARYFDPRFYAELDDEKIKKVKLYLNELLKRKLKLELPTSDSEADLNPGQAQPILPSETESDADSISNSEAFRGSAYVDDAAVAKDYEVQLMDELQQKLRNKVIEQEKQNRDMDIIDPALLENFKLELNRCEKNYGKFEIKPPKQKKKNQLNDVLTYWEEQNSNTSTATAAKFAKMVLGVAITEVSVERIFSQLRFIYSDLREKLGAVVLNNIILIRCNSGNIPNLF